MPEVLRYDFERPWFANPWIVASTAGVSTGGGSRFVSKRPGVNIATGGLSALISGLADWAITKDTAYDKSGYGLNGELVGKAAIEDSSLVLDGGYVDVGMPEPLYELSEVTVRVRFTPDMYRQQGIVNWHNFQPYGIYLGPEGDVGWVYDWGDIGVEWWHAGDYVVGDVNEVVISHRFITGEMRAVVNGEERTKNANYTTNVPPVPENPFYVGLRYFYHEPVQPFYGAIGFVSISNEVE